MEMEMLVDFDVMDYFFEKNEKIQYWVEVGGKNRGEEQQKEM
jgi:hypothetical protein